MFFLIGKSNPYYDDLNKHFNHNFLTKRIEAFEFQLKKKYEKVKEFSPEDCYNFSDNSSEYDFSGSEVSASVFDQNDSSRANKSKLRSNQTLNAPLNKNPYIQEKIRKYKFLIKCSDILSFILLILGSILSQLEEEWYYFSNIFYRVTAVVMINYVYSNPFNHSMALIFSEVNMTLLTSNYETNIGNNSLEDCDCSYYITNECFLSNLNLSKFNYTDNVTSYDEILVPLEIDEASSKIRAILLFTTIAGCALIFLSRYLAHIREYICKKEEDLPFHKGKYFLYTLMEMAFAIPVQYPNMNSYIIFTQLGSAMCLPYSSIMASLAIFRFIFLYKVLKHFTLWNSDLAEKKCDKNSCEANICFAFKAVQKEYPFFTLFTIFALTCVCFGFSLRNFELFYWETQPELLQNWRYHWNALWCVFVSMSTVGYGDFYPKTHLGRFIIIIACLVGLYFVSMTMVFMTKKSVLNESEHKAYKLINRLNLRKKMNDTQSFIVWHFFQTVSLKKRKEDNKDFDIKYYFERRTIISRIDEKKVIDRKIKNVEFFPTVEKLYDICEKIDTDIKEIRNEVESLEYINESVIGFTESQIDVLKYLKKNIYATKLLYDIIDKKPQIYDRLADFDTNIIKDGNIRNIHYTPSVSFNANAITKNNSKESSRANDLNNLHTLKPNEVPSQKNTVNENLANPNTPNLFANESYHPSSNQDNNEDYLNISANVVNPNQFDENITTTFTKFSQCKNNENASDDEEGYYAEELCNYDVTPDEIKEHFNHLFFNQKDYINANKLFPKNNSLNRTIKNMKKKQSELKMHLSLSWKKNNYLTIASKNNQLNE